MSIRYKLLVAFSIVLALAAGVAFFGVRAISDAGALVVRLYDEPFMAVSHARAAQAKFNEARSVMERELLIGNSASQKTLDVLKAAMKETMEELEVVQVRMAQTDSDDAIKNAQALIQDWYRTGLMVIDRSSEGLRELPPSTALVKKAGAVADAIDQVVEAASSFGFQFRSEAEAKVVDSRGNLIILATVTGVIGVFLSLGVAYSLVRPIRHAMAIAERVAAGNLAEEISTKRRDELGRLLVSLGAMQQALRSQVEAGRREADAKEQEQLKQVELRRQAEEERRTAEEELRGIVQAASAGDFSKRVALEGKTGVLLDVGTSINTLCDNVATALNDLIQMLSALADGDLTKRITADYQGDFATIKDDANRTADRLTETVSDIKAVGREVSNAAAEISASTTDLSRRTEGQAASLEQTSASMEEMSSTVKKNAENALQANQLTNGSRDVADRGGQVVAKAVDAMARIEESSRKISDIIGVIDEIARQTNLLALNAAVEAARAGDAGRGFAVVAAEVRSLAQRSSQAAKDIKVLITNSSSQVQEGVGLVNQAGTSLTGILASIKQVADIVAEIASASQEQSTGIDQINNALNQMDEATQQNSALVEENAASAKMLEHQSETMNEKVAFFKLDDRVESTEVSELSAQPKMDPRRTAA